MTVKPIRRWLRLWLWLLGLDGPTLTGINKRKCWIYLMASIQIPCHLQEKIRQKLVKEIKKLRQIYINLNDEYYRMLSVLVLPSNKLGYAYNCNSHWHIFITGVTTFAPLLISLLICWYKCCNRAAICCNRAAIVDYPEPTRAIHSFGTMLRGRLGWNWDMIAFWTRRLRTSSKSRVLMSLVHI